MTAWNRNLTITVFVLLIASPGVPVAAQDTDDEMKKQIDLLAERVRVLEEALRVKTQEQKAGADESSSQARVDPADATAAPQDGVEPTANAALQERVDALDAEVERLGYAQRSAAALKRLEEIELTGAVTTFMQGIAGREPDGLGAGRGVDASFSGDLAMTVPLGAYGRALARTLVGQGRGVTGGLPPLFSSPNADLEKHGDGLSIAELWYEATFAHPTVIDRRFSVAVGKMDPRRFFDTNSAANNQRQQFLADTFVNNLTIDWGGDENGYGLGTRLGYRFTSIYDQSLTVGGQLGVFEVGGDPLDAFGGPFVIGELDVTRRSYGLLSNYRMYAWTNLADHVDYTHASAERGNWGVGASLDQQLSGDYTIFGRYGWQNPAVSRFDHVITAGGKIVGNRWGRGGDVLGVAAGYTHASKSYARASKPLDGINVSGGETYIEAYYSYFLDSGFRLSPDIQYIRRPGAMSEAKDPFVFALRAQFDF